MAKTENKGKEKAVVAKVVKIAAPPASVQSVLRSAVVPYLDVLNVYDLGKRCGSVSAVRNYLEKNIPFTDGMVWVRFKTELQRDAAVMDGFVKALREVKNKI